MSGDDGNGQPAARRYVIVDHDGESVEMDYDGIEGTLEMAIVNELLALPVGGRFTVTRVA